ncbi:hypothetical protein GEMRC1_006681 [Eukaryota sp. GEM-RC1]
MSDNTQIPSELRQRGLDMLFKRFLEAVPSMPKDEVLALCRQHEKEAFAKSTDSHQYVSNLELAFETATYPRKSIEFRTETTAFYKSHVPRLYYFILERQHRDQSFLSSAQTVLDVLQQNDVLSADDYPVVIKFMSQFEPIVSGDPPLKKLSYSVSYLRDVMDKDILLSRSAAALEKFSASESMVENLFSGNVVGP